MWVLFEWGVVGVDGYEEQWLVTGESGQMWGAHWVYVVWRENGQGRGGAESGRQVSGFGVGREFWEGGGCRVWCVSLLWGAGGWG